MTSRLHKKPPITPPSIRLGRVIDLEVSNDFPVLPLRQQDSTWLPAALLATLTLLVGALQALGGEPDLQWRRTALPDKPVVRSTQAAPAKAEWHAAVASKNPASKKPASKNSTAKARPSTRTERPTYHRHDKGVVTVAYQADQPQAFSRQAGWASTADHHDAHHASSPRTEIVQLAQNRYDDQATDDALGRELNQPFGLPKQPDTLPAGPNAFDELPEPTDLTEPQPAEPSFLDNDNVAEPDVQNAAPSEPGVVAPPSDDWRKQPERDPFEPTPLPAESDPFKHDPYDPDLTEREDDQKLQMERQEVQKRCDVQLQKLRDSHLDTISLAITLQGEAGTDFPYECSVDDGTLYVGRHWEQTTYMWKAAANCHKPLYFEQEHLERYGHSWGPCLQPVVSGAHFFTRLPVLPYCMGLKAPNECVYPLGHYRPGNCAPYMVNAVPFTWRAVAFQAGATVGVSAILP